jgi:hypothetical protein
LELLLSVNDCEDRAVGIAVERSIGLTIEEQMPGCSDLEVGEDYDGSFTEIRFGKNTEDAGGTR